MKIKIEIKLQFKPRAYPACKISKAISELIGKQTFNSHHIKLIKLLGYKVEYIGYMDGVEYLDSDISNHEKKTD